MMYHNLKFSYDYAKLPLGWDVGTTKARLIFCHPVELSAQNYWFLEFDTRVRGSSQLGKHYDLPERGSFILLLFEVTDGANKGAVFQTLRSNKPGKWDYYKPKVGETFLLVKTSEPTKE